MRFVAVEIGLSSSLVLSAYCKPMSVLVNTMLLSKVYPLIPVYVGTLPSNAVCTAVLIGLSLMSDVLSTSDKPTSDLPIT